MLIIPHHGLRHLAVEPIGLTELPIVTIPEWKHIPVGRAKVRS
jgi:hypothetical protein